MSQHHNDVIIFSLDSCAWFCSNFPCLVAALVEKMRCASSTGNSEVDVNTSWFHIIVRRFLCCGRIKFNTLNFFHQHLAGSMLLDQQFRQECGLSIPYPKANKYETLLKQRHVQVNGKTLHIVANIKGLCNL